MKGKLITEPNQCGYRRPGMCGVYAICVHPIVLKNAQPVEIGGHPGIITPVCTSDNDFPKNCPLTAGAADISRSYDMIQKWYRVLKKFYD